MKTICFCNQKGGVGKSTSAITVSAGLKRRGFKVLAIDLDPQLCLTSVFRADPENVNIFSVLTGGVKLKDAIQHTDECDVVPASRMLTQADMTLTRTGKEYKLREALNSVKDLYDFCVIDTSPALGILSVNALTASDGVIIPATADSFGVEGISYLMTTIRDVTEYCNPSLKIEGILLTMTDRTSVTKSFTALSGKIADTIGTRVFRSLIRRAVAIRESQLSLESLYKYSPSAPVTQDYEHFIDELLGNTPAQEK